MTLCHHGAIGAALVGGGPGPVALDLVLDAPLVRANDPFRTRDAEAQALAVDRCHQHP